MKTSLKVAFLLLICALLMLGCQNGNKEPFLFFNDDQGETILTNRDLTTMKVISLIHEKGSRGFYIVFKDDNRLEELTRQQLNRTIDAYYHEELIFSSEITQIIRGDNVTFNELSDEVLATIETILQEI
ncbi:hypothetical protein [Cohnella hongkongensis]|uniref:Uncharacterized protein n=1 Tax=Cohnella hongkongensis TaxID=178337 RepID=A0ABV9FFU7_9BACL